MDENLSAEADEFPLQDQVDQIDRLIRLCFFVSVSDLISVEPQIKPPDGDGSHDDVMQLRAVFAAMLLW
jgi:hypothetical protein